MPKCCLACHKGVRAANVDEMDSPALDLHVIEARERSLKIGFSVPRWRASVRPAREPCEFLISVLGGPHGDLRGAKEEKMVGGVGGSRAVHEVNDLEPQTEYTIRLTMLSPPQGHVVNESIDARTADATTALFAGEDWGGLHGSSSKSGFKSGDYETNKTGGKQSPDDAKGKGDSSGSGGSTGASSSAGPWPRQPHSSSAAAAADDESSTIAPSEAQAVGEEAWDSDPEGADGTRDGGYTAAGATAPRTASLDSAASAAETDGGSSTAACAAVDDHGLECSERTVHLDEVCEDDGISVLQRPGFSRRLAQQCNLCSMMDCWRPSGLKARSNTGREANLDEDAEIVISRRDDPPAQQQRRFRPYRIPFPGRAVDPSSVGLSHLQRRGDQRRNPDADGGAQT